MEKTNSIEANNSTQAGIDLDNLGETRKCILIVEDEADTVFLLKQILLNAGFNVRSAFSGREAIEKVTTFHPDLVLLDLMMPEMDGWETFKYIRQVMDLPIIILSALAVKEDIVKALELGVDDYITKPFFNDEVVARVRNVLRRIQGANQEDVLYISDLDMFLDLTLQVIRVGEKTIQLTSREFDLFYLLVKKSPKVVKYEEITKSIWGEDTDDARNRLKFLVYLLRKKLETVIQGQEIVLNLDRIGYKISI